MTPQLGHMGYTVLMLGIAACLFVAMLVAIEMGRRFAIRQLAKKGEASRIGVGVVDSTVYGLLGLLIGFTFSGGAARLDHRRELMVQEVGAVSTAWQRTQILPSESMPAIRAQLREYVDALIAVYAAVPGSEPEQEQRSRLRGAEARLWADAVRACLAPGGEAARMLVLPALNELFDVVDTERLAQRIHPPMSIWAMLAVAALAASLFAGYAIASASTRNWLYIVGVAATVSAAAYVIMDMESPRLGLIRVDTMDRALIELRATMTD